MKIGGRLTARKIQRDKSKLRKRVNEELDCFDAADLEDVLVVVTTLTSSITGAKMVRVACAMLRKLLKTEENIEV